MFSEAATEVTRSRFFRGRETPNGTLMVYARKTFVFFSFFDLLDTGGTPT